MPDETQVAKSLKARAADWLFTQGTSTVLLFSILLLLAYGIPWGYREFKAWHDASENKRIEERKQAADVVAGALGKSNAATTEAILKVTESVTKSAANIERNTEVSKETKEALKELTLELRKDRNDRRDHRDAARHGVNP